MKKLFAMATLAVAAVSVNAEVTPRTPLVPWGAQAEIIITNDLTQQNSDNSWGLTADAQQWITTTYDGEESTLVQQTNRNSVWFDIYDEATDTMIVTGAEKNWGGQIAVTSKTGAATGLIVVGKNRYPHFFVTGTDKAKFYFYGSAGTAGYARIEVFEVGATEPVMTLQGTKAQTKKTWSDGELLIAEGLDKAKSYEFVARTMAFNAETGEYTYEGGDMVLQVVKLYGDVAPMREDGLIISGSEIGSYINQHLAAYPDVTDFTLEGSGKYTIAEGIVAAGKFTLTGVASAPATIDASALEAPFVKFSGSETYAQKPVVDAETGETTYENSTFFDVPEVTIANVKITSLAQSLINDAQKSLFTAINVTNDNIEIVGSNAIFALGNGYPTNLTISKSTLWSAEGHKGFLFQAQGRPAKDFAADATATFSIENSTLFQIGVDKKINNNNSGLKGQTCLHLNLTKSILVNTGSSTGNEINGWLFGQNSTNPTVTYDQNTYWTLGTMEVTDEETGETSTEIVSEIVPGWTDAEKQGSDQTETQLTTAPFTLAKAAAGDFTVGASSQQAKNMTGDPRWLVPYATDAIKIEVDLSENTDFVAVLNAALETSEAPSSIEISFWEAGEYPTTGEINTTSPIRFLNGSDINAGEATIVVKNGMTLGGQIEFNGVNIDATGLEAPVITLAANEYKLQSNGFYNLGSISFKNMSAKGLAQQLVYGNKIKNQISELLVENSNVDLTGCTKVPFDFNGGGAIGAFNIKKSTIWAATATDQSLFSTQSGNKAIDAGYTTQNIAIDNSTLYNIAKSKNFFTHRQSNQTWLAYYLRNNIFVNVGKSGQVVKGINQGQGGKNPKWTVTNNIFNFDGADTSAAESTGDADEPVQNSIAGTMTFENADGGIFNGSFALAKDQAAPSLIGDPRWTIDFAEWTPAGVFYVYNAYSDKFLSRGASWGTQAVGDDYGLPFDITSADGKYSLNQVDWIGTCYGDDFWMYADCSGDRARTYTLESTTGGFFLHNTNRDVEDNRMYIYLKDDADKYAIAGNAIVGDNCGDEAQAVWQFKTQAERDAIVAERNTKQEAAAIEAAGIEDMSKYAAGEAKELTFKTGSAWTFTAKRSGSNAVTNEYGTEIYQGTGSFTQGVEGLESGLYKVSVQAYYRDGWNDAVWSNYQLGYNLSLAYLEANGNKIQIKSWGADATRTEETTTNEETGEETTTEIYAPNSMAEGAASFAEGKFVSETYAFVGEDGKLDLTVVVPSFIDGGWFMIDNVSYAPMKDDTTVGIETVATESNAINNGVIYNLRGQKVLNAQKGIFIQNGKKFIVK